MGLKFMGQVKYLSHNKSNYFVKGGDERLKGRAGYFFIKWFGYML